MNLHELFGRQRRSILVALGSVVLALVGVGDYFAIDRLLEFSVFFVLPVAFFVWFIHRKAGVIASVASAGIALGVNLASPLHDLYPRVGYWNALLWLGFFLFIVAIMGELKTLYLRERQLSRVDDLTRIPNRLAFYELATAEKNRAHRYGHPITLAYVDVDDFKGINDSLGHGAGDKLLSNVAQTMRNNIRLTDTVARMGGDEFALLLPNTNQQAAAKVLRKVMKMLDRSMQQNHWRVSFSMGAVTFATPPATLQEMIKRADEVMYSIKCSGKNRLRKEEVAA